MKPFTLFCPHCNFSQLVVKEYKIRTIKHVETGNYKTLIHYEARRYECKQCKRTFYETNKFATPQHRVSNLLKINIMEDLKTSTLTFTYVAQKFGLSPTTVIKIFDSNLSIPRLQLPKVLCIDEIHIPMILHKSRYICVLMDWRHNDLIEVLPSRKKEDLKRYFDTIPKEELALVNYVSTDMYDTYIDISKKYLPNALICIDSFHVIENIFRAFIGVRVKIMNKVKLKLTQDKSDNVSRQQYYLLKKWNWLLTKKNVNLDNKAKLNHVLNRYVNYRQILNLILDIDPKLSLAYELYSRYLYFNDHCTINDARSFLDVLIQDFAKSEILEFIPIASMLVKYKEYILNSFHTVLNRRISNGPMENMNGRIDKIELVSNGVRNFQRFRCRALYCFNKTITFSLNSTYHSKKNKMDSRGPYKK